MTDLTNTEIIVAERDMLFAMLCRLAKNMHLLEAPRTGSFSGDYTLWAQIEPRNFYKLQDLQYRQGLEQAGIKALPFGTPVLEGAAP